MDDKIKVKTKISYQYIPSSKEYEFTVTVGIPADDEGYLPQVLRYFGADFFEQSLMKKWGKLIDGVLYAHRSMQFRTFDEGEKWAKDYAAKELRNLERVAQANRKQFSPRHRGKEGRFYI